jgi:hypothetical protein
MLSRHDIIILDPYQSKVIPSLAVLRKYNHHSLDIIGRLDLEAFPSSRIETQKSDKFFIKILDQIMNVALRPFKELDVSDRFTGILLAGWGVFPVPILHEFTKILRDMGLDVYLEISPPAFLEESAILNSNSIAGVVIRNGLSWRTGERQIVLTWRPCVQQ